MDRHQNAGAATTVVTAVVDDPHGYGRIVRSGEGIARIVEEKDATPDERQIREGTQGDSPVADLIPQHPEVR